MGYLPSVVDLDRFSEPLETGRGLRKDPDREYKREGSPRPSSLRRNFRIVPFPAGTNGLASSSAESAAGN